jgi:DNA-directed RNA polymerase omega subunit
MSKVPNMPEKIDSKFRFVLVAAERAEQLMRGARPHVDATQKKATRVAQTEVHGDKVDWDYGPEPSDAPAETAAGGPSGEEEVH